MKLYERNYFDLLPEEVTKYEELTKKEKINEKTLPIIKSQWRNYPSAVRKNLSIFPNNFLDPVELTNSTFITSKLDVFKNLLENQLLNERLILNAIKQHQAYFIIGSILNEKFSFGHHDAFLFPEFKLGTSYVCDYLVVGKSSGGFEFLFIELEDPMQKCTQKTGELGLSYRKGIKQINDWSEWLESNFNLLKGQFEAYAKPDEKLDPEFYSYDSSRIHFCVIAGRRIHYSKKTYRLRRKYNSNNILLLHYDNLYDFSIKLIGEATY